MALGDGVKFSEHFNSLKTFVGRAPTAEIASYERFSLRGLLSGHSSVRAGRIYATGTRGQYRMHTDMYPVGIRHGRDLANGLINGPY